MRLDYSSIERYSFMSDYQDIMKQKASFVVQSIKNRIELQAKKQEQINKINELKSYLSSTDYICNKLTEALALGDITKLEELKIKYSDVLIEREKTRILIDELEKY